MACGGGLRCLQQQVKGVRGPVAADRAQVRTGSALETWGLFRSVVAVAERTNTTREEVLPCDAFHA